MNLDNLRIFQLVAEHGSLTKAANTIGSLQPIVSRKISALERDCGGRLFDRTGRGLVLTEFGERVLLRVDSLLVNADQLSLEIKSGSGLPTGEVHIGILPSLSDPVIYLLYNRLRQLYPGILLHALEGSTGQIDEWLNSGRIDIAVRFRYGGRAGRNDSTRNDSTLGEVQTCLVSSPDKLITRKETVEFDELKGLPLILPSLPNMLRATLEQMAKRNHFNLSVVMEADSLAILKGMAASGSAYAILASHSVTREVEAGTLQASKIVTPGIDRYNIELATTTQRPLSHAGREVARLVRCVFDERFLQPA